MLVFIFCLSLFHCYPFKWIIIVSYCYLLGSLFHEIGLPLVEGLILLLFCSFFSSLFGLLPRGALSHVNSALYRYIFTLQHDWFRALIKRIYTRAISVYIPGLSRYNPWIRNAREVWDIRQWDKSIQLRQLFFFYCEMLLSSLPMRSRHKYPVSQTIVTMVNLLSIIKNINISGITVGSRLAHSCDVIGYSITQHSA